MIAFDNRGVGASEGTTPNSVAAMAHDAVAFIRALGLEQVDLLTEQLIQRLKLSWARSRTVGVRRQRLRRSLRLTSHNPGEPVNNRPRRSKAPA